MSIDDSKVKELADYRMEEEVKKISPQGEELMMLSDIREESECDHMSTRGDDEEETSVTTEVSITFPRTGFKDDLR